MDTNLFWMLRGNYAERKALLAAAKREFLEAAILDMEYNDFLRSRADAKDSDADKDDILNGKRIPYMGWFYRHLNFSEGCLPLGFSGGYVAFMATNKWDNDERDTTPEEFEQIMAYIDAAMKANERGGALSEIVAGTNAELKKLRDYLQTLPRLPARHSSGNSDGRSHDGGSEGL